MPTSCLAGRSPNGTLKARGYLLQTFSLAALPGSQVGLRLPTEGLGGAFIKVEDLVPAGHVEGTAPPFGLALFLLWRWRCLLE